MNSYLPKPTPRTNAVAREIGRLAAKWKFGDIRTADFTTSAQAEIDKLGEMERPCPTCGTPPASLIEDAYATDLVPWWRYYAQKFNPCRLIRLIRRKTEFKWYPIETAPKDGRIRIMIAAFRCGELVDLDFDAVLEWECESWEMPQEYLVWKSAHGRIEEPTHWCPLPPLP